MQKKSIKIQTKILSSINSQKSCKKYTSTKLTHDLLLNSFITSTKNIPVHSEHYDLPKSYNLTYLKLLAQSPKILFAFWELTDYDKQILLEKYGYDFFEKTIPVLLVINKTNNTSFYIEINDYAHNWYIEVDDSNCVFEVQLGRRELNTTSTFTKVISSNDLESPNDHILLERLPEKFLFKNIKTNTIIKKDKTEISLNKTVYAYYKNLNYEETMDNPSSNMQ